MKDGFHITIETIHVPNDVGQQENVSQSYMYIVSIVLHVRIHDCRFAGIHHIMYSVIAIFFYLASGSQSSQGAPVQEKCGARGHRQRPSVSTGTHSIARKFGGELNLVVWRSILQNPPKFPTRKYTYEYFRLYGTCTYMYTHAYR